MGVRLSRQVYGKSSVRLTKVTRRADRHDLIELSVDISLEGDFAESYQAGDNRRVIATDTMKNTVYALAADHPLADAGKLRPDSSHRIFSTAIRTSHRSQSRRSRPLGNGSKRPAPATVTHSSAAAVERRTCAVCRTRERVTVESGLAGLPLLKTADSAFRDFARDEFTTLADTDDRIFATRLDARWVYDVAASVDWNWCMSGLGPR